MTRRMREHTPFENFSVGSRFTVTLHRSRGRGSCGSAMPGRGQESDGVRHGVPDNIPIGSHGSSCLRSAPLLTRVVLLALALDVIDASCRHCAPQQGAQPTRAVKLVPLALERVGYTSESSVCSLHCSFAKARRDPLRLPHALRGGRALRSCEASAESLSDKTSEEERPAGDVILPDREAGSEKWDEAGTVTKEVLVGGDALAASPEMGDLVCFTLLITAAGKEVRGVTSQ